MRISVAAFVTLLLALTLTISPSSAVTQEGRHGATFRLTLDGDPAPGEAFIVWIVDWDAPIERPSPLRLCGWDSGIPCGGEGTVYTKSIRFPDEINEVEYAFDRVIPGTGLSGRYSRHESFKRGTITAGQGQTVSATYSYPPGKRGGEQPELPQVGAGGSARGRTVAPVAVFSLLAIATHRVLRPHRNRT